MVHLIGALNTQITTLETELTSAFEQHAYAEIVASLPGLGPVSERWPSLVTIPLRTAMQRHVRPTLGRRRSPARLAHATPCSLVSRATAISSMPASAGRTRR
jgi:hypothetical protein